MNMAGSHPSPAPPKWDAAAELQSRVLHCPTAVCRVDPEL